MIHTCTPPLGGRQDGRAEPSRNWKGTESIIFFLLPMTENHHGHTASSITGKVGVQCLPSPSIVFSSPHHQKTHTHTHTHTHTYTHTQAFQSQKHLKLRDCQVKSVQRSFLLTFTMLHHRRVEPQRE